MKERELKIFRLWFTRWNGPVGARCLCTEYAYSTVDSQDKQKRRDVVWPILFLLWTHYDVSMLIKSCFMKNLTLLHLVQIFDISEFLCSS